MTTPSEPTDLPFHLLGEPLKSYVDWLRRRHGLTGIGAALVALTALLGVVGPSRRILNPIDLSFLPPTLNLVLFGQPVLHLQAATNLALDPIRQWILQRVTDTRRTRLRIAELNEQLIQQDFLLRSTTQPVTPGITPATEQEVEARRDEIQTERRKILGQISDANYRVRPYNLCDDAPVRRLLEPAELSHDAGVLAASTTGFAVTALTQASKSQKAQLARLLVLGSQGVADIGSSPQLSNLIVTTPGGAAKLFTDEQLKTTGVVSQILFTPALCEDAATDVFADCKDEISEQWIASLQALISARITGQVTDHMLTPEAVARFQGLLASADGPAPALCLKLALLAYSGQQESDQIEDKVLEFAIALATGITSLNNDFIAAHEPAPVTMDSEIEAIIARVRVRGPLCWRQLLRGQRIQKADPLTRLLSEAVETGRLRREGDLFFAD